MQKPHIFIKEGSLLDEPSGTFIVNPSNTLLTLGSGVSGAFRQKCGVSLQKAMNEALQKFAPLSKGDVVLTKGCDVLDFEWIMHVTVMDYSQGVASSNVAPTYDDIQKVLGNMEKIFREYATNNAKRVKVVLSLMGTGVGGLQKRKVAELYREFFSHPREYPLEVVIYGHTRSDVGLLEKVFDHSQS